jgi:hypothetical protein
MPRPPRGETAHGINSRMRALVPLALLIAAPGLMAGGEPIPRVTTDSREYCVELADRLLGLPGADDDAVQRMALDGLWLCNNGHPRTGVAKLRRAIRAARAPARP